MRTYYSILTIVTVNRHFNGSSDWSMGGKSTSERNLPYMGHAGKTPWVSGDDFPDSTNPLKSENSCRLFFQTPNQPKLRMSGKNVRLNYNPFTVTWETPPRNHVLVEDLHWFGTILGVVFFPNGSNLSIYFFRMDPMNVPRLGMILDQPHGGGRSW